MATTRTKPIKTVTEDLDYMAARQKAEEAEQALHQRLAERAKVEKAARRSAYMPELDADALVAGEKRPDRTSDHTFNDHFNRLTGEIKTLRPHAVKLKQDEKKARRLATSRIAETFKPARDACVKRFHSTLGTLYEVGVETAAMINLLNEESGYRHYEGGYPYQATMLEPYPKFQRQWLIGRAAEFYKSDGLSIPPAMLADDYAREVLLNKHGIRV